MSTPASDDSSDSPMISVSPLPFSRPVPGGRLRTVTTGRVIAIMLLCAPLPAAEQAGLHYDAALPEFRSVEVMVTDEAGQPVSGASLMPVALVCKDRLYYCSAEDHKLVPVGRSDDSGVARSRLPAQLPDRSKVLAAHWSVGHQEYVSASVESVFGQNPVQCRLKRGRRIAVSVIDLLTQERVQSDLFVVLSGPAVADRWSLMKSGILVSDGLDTSRRTLRIAHLPPDQPAQFSAAIDLSDYQERPRVFLHDVEVQPGTRVEGRLDDRVPRPVRRGIVSAFVVRGKNEWHEMSDIASDGTFALNSLPRGEIVQLTAACDDWVSSDPTLDELQAADMQDKASRLQRSRVYPQVVRLQDDVVRPVIRMEPATTCRIRVVEAGGAPIEGAFVRLIPYQGSFDGRSHVFGHGESTRRRLQLDSPIVAVRQRVELGIARDIRRRFTATTGDDGIAEIKSLPGGPDGSPAMTSFVVTHPDYFGASDGGLGDQGSSRAALYSGRTTDVVVRMKRK